MNLVKLLKKNTLLEKFRLLEKRELELMEERMSFLTPQLTPIPKLSMTSMVWSISIGYLSGRAPSQLPHTCSSADHGKLEKVLYFIATTKTISVINILLILNPNHSSY